MKLGQVRKGWKLLSVLSVKVEPARFNTGKLPYFEPSELSPDGKTVVKPGGWRGGTRWLSE